MAQNTVPSPVPQVFDSNLEITWETFIGDTGAAIPVAVIQFCYQHNLPLDSESVKRQFELHLVRGIAYLVWLKLFGIEELVELALADRSTEPAIAKELSLSPVVNKVVTKVTEASRHRPIPEIERMSNSIKLVWKVPDEVRVNKHKKRISKKLEIRKP